MLIRELRTLPGPVPPLRRGAAARQRPRIRPQRNKQAGMNAGQAAELTAVLRPGITVPHRYAITGS
jgi:hypothetical protein